MNTKPVILLIDDEDELRSIAADILRPQYDIIEFIEGRSAWQALRSGLRPDLIVTDMHLPIMTGPRLIANLRSHPELSRIPLLLVSADEQGADVAAGMSVTHFLSKPYDADQLLGAIKLALGR